MVGKGGAMVRGHHHHYATPIRRVGYARPYYGGYYGGYPRYYGGYGYGYGRRMYGGYGGGGTCGLACTVIMFVIGVCLVIAGACMVGGVFASMSWGYSLLVSGAMMMISGIIAICMICCGVCAAKTAAATQASVAEAGTQDIPTVSSTIPATQQTAFQHPYNTVTGPTIPTQLPYNASTGPSQMSPPRYATPPPPYSTPVPFSSATKYP